jgi:putative flippase GtrA
MNKLLITLAVAVAAGLIDIAPMLLRGTDRTTVASVFVHWFVTTIFISYAVMPIPPMAKGALIAALSTLPILITYAAVHPERLLPIFAIAIVLGAVIGYVTNRFAF